MDSHSQKNFLVNFNLCELLLLKCSLNNIKIYEVYLQLMSNLYVCKYSTVQYTLYITMQTKFRLNLILSIYLVMLLIYHYAWEKYVISIKTLVVTTLEANIPTTTAPKLSLNSVIQFSFSKEFIKYSLKKRHNVTSSLRNYTTTKHSRTIQRWLYLNR